MLAELSRAPLSDPRTVATLHPPDRGRAPVGTAIEVARRRLRHGYRLEAAELLDRCVQALARERVEDPLLAERWAYALDRCTGNGRTSLHPDVLQRVIVWVTREELEAGERALAADRPFAAARFLMAADRIDARGTRSAFVHALALQRAAHKSMDRAADAERAGPDAEAAPPEKTMPAHLHRAERCLRRAGPLVERAAEDSELRLQCDHLTVTLERHLAVLVERRATADRMAAACACLVDYDAFVRHYAGEAMRSHADRASFQSSLGALSARIDRLLDRSPAGSAEARLLGSLSAGVTTMLRSYPR